MVRFCGNHKKKCQLNNTCLNKQTKKKRIQKLATTINYIYRNNCINNSFISDLISFKLGHNNTKKKQFFLLQKYFVFQTFPHTHTGLQMLWNLFNRNSNKPLQTNKCYNKKPTTTTNN